MNPPSTLLALAFVVLTLSGCARETVDVAHDRSALRDGIGTWTQFHANAPSEGSLFVATLPALEPIWTFPVGSAAQSSPVVGPDGTIYVTNIAGDVANTGSTEGELIAINPDGTLKWREQRSAVWATPAVAPDGKIYVISTVDFGSASPPPELRFASILSITDPSGELLETINVPDNGYTFGSPKLWSADGETFVFFHARTENNVLGKETSALFVYNQNGQLIQREDMGCSKTFTSSSPITDFFSDLIDVLTDPFGDFDPGIPFADQWRLEPTVAIAEPTGRPPRDRPIIVVVDQQCANIHAFRFGTSGIEELWVKELNDDNKAIRHSSPAILNQATLVVVGREDGKVIAYDFSTGNELWEYDAGEPVFATPASLGGLIYVVSETHIQILEPATGDLVPVPPFDRRKLRGRSYASPAMSGSRVYISDTAELGSWSFDLYSVGHDAAPGGMSSPAIASDGTIYAISWASPSRLLRAYAGP